MTMNKAKDAEEKLQYTKYEKARMIGSRALQIAMGAPFLLKLTPEELEKVRYDPMKISMMEYEADVIPITVKRPLPLKKE